MSSKTTLVLSCKARQGGFTLIELLVAMTVLSLIGLIMLGGLKFGSNVWERAQTTADDVESVETVQNLLRRQLSVIYPQREIDANGLGYVLFDGASQSIAFIAPPPAQLGPGPNKMFKLHIDTAGNLELNWDSAASQSSDDPPKATLLRRIKSISVSYFGPNAVGQNPVWSDNWTARGRLPQLIRIDVLFPQGDRRTWPELIVHPAITVDITCVYDAISQGCRGRPE